MIYDRFLVSSLKCGQLSCSSHSKAIDIQLCRRDGKELVSFLHHIYIYIYIYIHGSGERMG
jgi:hypothetical protein